MFKLFKKVIAPKVIETQAIIAEIHNEFDTAGERLLNEAKRILSQDVDVEKGERLKKIGFTSTKEVVESEKVLKEKAASTELAKLIEYYQQWYPNNKFITEDVVKVICDKYGLLCGDVSRYKGCVPEKNISEIESFELREDDKEKRTNLDDYHRRSSFLAMANAISRPQYGIPNPYISSLNEPPKVIREYTVQPAFKICAPESDFDTMGYRKEGHKLVEIPDPIVLQPVKGGYLIVSKWGLEASDEIIVNEKLN